MGYSRKIIGKNRNLKKRSRKGGMSGESVVDVLKRHNKESKSAASTAVKEVTSNRRAAPPPLLPCTRRSMRRASGWRNNI